jgi:hypothetical protein
LGGCGRRNILNSETKEEILGVEERWDEMEKRSQGVEGGEEYVEVRG